ncbi:MAG: NUDIX hydrolase, partial [Treponema sp.]|nr:NUDIX hydrolase [Treponema sp.]
RGRGCQGALEKGEDASEGARRELLEETGYMCENLTLLGSFSPNPALMSNRVHIFLAENLKKIADQELDNDEYVQFLELEQDEVFFKLQNDTSTHILWQQPCCFTKNIKIKQVV